MIVERVLPIIILMLLVYGNAVSAQDGEFAAAVGTMKREQTLGEANAGLLKTFAKNDIAVMVRGIRLYARVQADLNSFIETLYAELIVHGEPEQSEDYAAILQQAANQRMAFTEFVEEKILSQSEEGSRSMAAVLGSGDLIAGIAELVTALKDAGLDIWQAFQNADEKQQKQILDQLDSLKWRSFDQVPTLG